MGIDFAMALQHTQIGCARPISNGFTLIELSVSLIILAMLAAMTAPYIPNAINSMQFKSATRELAYFLRAARSNAVAQQHETVVNLDLEKALYWTDQSKKTKPLPRNVHIKLITARSEQFSQNSSAIRFFPDGSSTGGQIIITSEKSFYTIDVNWLNGRVTILDES